MKTIRQKYEIKASPERVFKALTDQKDIETWSGSRATFESRKEGNYSMWDDWVKGTVLDYDPPEKLSQTWEPSDWEPQKEKSVATFILNPQNGKTEIEFMQTNVPDHQYKSTRDGWKDFYLGAIKEYLERL